MASIDVIQIQSFMKEHQLTNIDTSFNTLNSQQQTIIPPANISRQEITQTKYSFNESDTIRQVRVRSLSHWMHSLPTCESIISAGWFSCNVNDRVICIYCNTICQGWTINDDPAEVHKRLAPECPFVLSMRPVENAPKIINDKFGETLKPAHPNKTELSCREATFHNTTWSESSPSVEDLVRAGFFYTGVENIVTCFYCNGSLHKWTPKDNPMLEHARWFPHCTYAKHLCGEQLHNKIQETKACKSTTNIVDQSKLNFLVAARIDLPVVQRLRTQYQLPVIKRCIEDQLRIKNDDFVSDIDLSIACLVLQKQMDHIKGCKDKIIVPSKHQQQQLKTPILPSKPSLGECVICLTEEKQLACMPCGHLCACVPCGYALRSCPVCRQKIQSFMRIHL